MRTFVLACTEQKCSPDDKVAHLKKHKGCVVGPIFLVAGRYSASDQCN